MQVELVGARMSDVLQVFGKRRKLVVVASVVKMLGEGATTLGYHWGRQYWHHQRPWRLMVLLSIFLAHPFIVVASTKAVGYLQDEAIACPALRKTSPWCQPQQLQSSVMLEGMLRPAFVV